MVFNALQRKAPQPRRQRILPVVIRDAQRPLKVHSANRLLVYSGKTENQFIVQQLDHDHGPSKIDPGAAHLMEMYGLLFDYHEGWARGEDKIPECDIYRTYFKKTDFQKHA